MLDGSWWSSSVPSVKPSNTPPVPICYNCRSFDFTWTPVERRGVVYSYIISYHPVHPSPQDHPSYNIALVELPHAGDVRMVGNVIDAAKEEVQVGMPVELT